MTQVSKKAELVEFEILQGLEEPARTVSPWSMLRFAAMALTSLALFAVILAFGILVMVPLLVIFVIAGTVSSLLPDRARS